MIQSLMQDWSFHSAGLVIAASLLVTACSDYEIRFNDRAIYTPPTLFSDYQLADAALDACVRETIKDKGITVAKDLTTLVCTNAGIESLNGLATFTELEQLNLAHNAIADLQPLAQLTGLKRLDVSDNDVRELTPLMALGNLEVVDLRDNTDLDCTQAAQLQLAAGATVVSPAYCD